MSAWEKPTDTFVAVNLQSPWSQVVDEVSAKSRPYEHDETLKKQFGIELAKAKNPFEAACVLAGTDTSMALWISQNWLTDPIVIANRDIYVQTVERSQPPLDKEQLAAKVLALAEEKTLNRQGVPVPSVEPKDRIAAFKLYSEIMGYTGKIEIDQSNKTTTITNNEIQIKLIRPKEELIDVTPKQVQNAKSNINDEDMPVTLKLVNASH